MKNLSTLQNQKNYHYIKFIKFYQIYQTTQMFSRFDVTRRGLPLSTYATGGGRLIQNAYSCVQVEGVSRMCTHALALSLFMFLEAFYSYGVLFYLWKFNFTFIQIKCACQKRLFFSNEINVCHHEINFFTMNHFC